MDDGERLVGQPAKRQAVTNPDQHLLRHQAPDRPQLSTTRWSRRTRAWCPTRSSRARTATPGCAPTARTIRPSRSRAFILQKMKEAAEALPRREGREGGHHRPGLFQRRPAPGDQGRRQDRRPGSPAHHQRADRGRAGLRPGQERRQEDRRLRPGRRHLRRLDPGDRRRRLRGEVDQRRHLPGRRGLRPAHRRLPGRRVQEGDRASTCARTSWPCSASRKRPKRPRRSCPRPPSTRSTCPSSR